jgi:hypothetical protein
MSQTEDSRRVQNSVNPLRPCIGFRSPKQVRSDSAASAEQFFEETAHLRVFDQHMTRIEEPRSVEVGSREVRFSA